MNKDQFNELSKNLAIKLSPENMTILHELGYVNIGDVVHALETFANKDELVNHVVENYLDEVKEAIQEAYS